jgi:tetratricopeptide (TPR) repeat protein
MLQWFNKQSTLKSPTPESLENQQHSGLAEEDYEFLFNQLLDGVAHGWHLGKVIKFFNNIESVSTPSQWLKWLEKFEQRIAYNADPSQKRVGAIMMRFGELTQSNFELEELGGAFHRIGKKLFLGDTTELIWEYSGQDRVIWEDKSLEVAPFSALETVTEIPESNSVDISNTEESVNNPTATPTATKLLDDTLETEIIESYSIEPEESKAETATTSSIVSPTATKLLDNTSESDSVEDLELMNEFTKQTIQSPETILDLELETEAKNSEINSVNSSIDSIEELTEQLTVLQNTNTHPGTSETEPEILKTFINSEETSKSDTKTHPVIVDEVSLTEEHNQSNNLVPESSSATNNSLESLEALTEQLTALHEIIPENDTHIETDSKITLIAPEATESAVASLSVASFLEATKTLVPQPQNQNVTPLTWEEFIVVLEQDPKLAQQVAEYLQISSTNPQDIVKASVSLLTQQEETKLSPATIELTENWFNLGLKQASAEDFQGAIASWEKALNLNDNLSEAWHNRGSALGRLGKYEEAIQSFNRAINIAPERYQAWNDRAHALYQIHKWEQAVESWDKAITIMSDNYQFWYNRGCALEQLKRYDESVSSYQKSLEIKPDFQPARTRYINLITENFS